MCGQAYVPVASAQPYTNPFKQFTPPYTPKPSPMSPTNPFVEAPFVPACQTVNSLLSNDVEHRWQNSFVSCANEQCDIVHAPTNISRGQHIADKPNLIKRATNPFHMADCASDLVEQSSRVEDAAGRDQKPCGATLQQVPVQPGTTGIVTNDTEPRADNPKREPINTIQRPTLHQQQVVANPTAVSADLVGVQPREVTHQAMYNFYQINHIGNHPNLGLPLDDIPKWPVSYEQLHTVAQELDSNDGWKMLASKLRIDTAIDRVSQWSRNKGESPTVMMLREWMKSREISQCDDAYQRLLYALTAMGRQDIIDRLEDLGELEQHSTLGLVPGDD